MLQRRSVQQYLRASSCIRNLQSSRPFSTGVDTHPKAPSAPTQQSPRNRRQGKQPSLTGGGAPKSKIHSRGSKTGAGHEKTSEKRLLHPHVLSARLIKICDDDQLNTAIDTLKNLPLDAQNVAVWNTLIRETLKAKRYQLAYQLYVDMKRRGFAPNTRTFTTMFAGFMAMEQWSSHTRQLQHMHTLFENYRDYMQTVKEHDPSSSELSVAPVAAYIRILADAGRYQEMFDVYYAMDEEGPLAPNQFTFTALIQALSSRKVSQGTESSAANIRTQNASDVKLLWRQMQKCIERNSSFQVDSHLIAFTLSTLSGGRPTDHLFAFDIIRDYLGLAKPGETPLPVKVEISSHILTEILWLCQVSQKYRLGIHFFNQIRDRPIKAGGELWLNRMHMESVLQLYQGLGTTGSLNESAKALETVEWMLRETILRNDGGRLRPSLSTFTLVLGACWRGGDWETAMKTFELMTGYKASDFEDGRASLSAPQMEARSSGRNIMPDTAAMSHIAHTALASREPAAMRQCLRIIDHLGAHRFLKDGESGPREEKYSAYYTAKMTRGFLDLVDQVVPKGSDKSTYTKEEKRWLALRTRFKETLRRSPSPNRTPFYEDSPLGSDRGLAATESIVEHDMTTRRMRT
ncbi:hypothetical protein AcV7_003496 [Taiwanofungus camphoratus]|nr:hypothetical protein AcW2_006290 [Antrodia cinnamomea]KAI0938264.1 hypothetical protein AcV7_003496 [Antrodia cinnamomea]